MRRIASDGNAQSEEFNQRTGPSSKKLSSTLSSPWLPGKYMYRHTSATATSGTMNGTKYMLVKKPRTVRFFKPFSTTARESPRTTTPGTVSPTNVNVTVSDFQNSGSSNNRNR